MTAAVCKQARGGSASQIFDFQSKLFMVEGVHLALAADMRAPSLFVRIGEREAALSLPIIPGSFQLSAHDRNLLDVVARSLRHVREIRPGDSIPSEILDGTASWTVEDRHRAAARNRLHVQLAHWASGREVEVGASEQLAALAADPAICIQRDAGRAKLATLLGPGADGESVIAKRIDQFARECA